MTKVGDKLGIMTSEEGKFLAKIIADEIPVNGLWQTGLKLILPAFINGLDDKVGDKIPMPWQLHIEELTTSLYEAFQDKVLTDEELNDILEKCSGIVNEEVDLPYLSEDDEAAAFLFLMQSIASLIRSGLKKRKEQE